MRNPNLLIWELVSVDAHAASSILPGDVSSLKHELLDDSVEDVPLVSEVLFSNAKTPEILSSLRNLLLEQLKHDSALLESLFTFLSNLNVHECLRVARFKVREFALDLGDACIFLVVQP